MSGQNSNDKSRSHLLGSLPARARALFALAALLLAGATGLLGEGLYFRATARRVEGTVIGHDKRGRSIVEYGWNGQRLRCDDRRPSLRSPLGAAVGVYVPPNDPSHARLAGPIPLLFIPAWCCVMPAMIFASYGVTVMITDQRQLAKAAEVPNTQARSASEGPGCD